MKNILVSGLVASIALTTPGQAVNSITLKNPLDHDMARVVQKPRAIESNSNELETKTDVDDSKIDIADYPTLSSHIEFVVEQHLRKVEEERLAQIEAERQRKIQEEKARLEEEKRLEEQRLEEHRRASVGFDPYNLLSPSNIAVHELETVLYNVTNGHGLAPYASYFVECEQYYGINAIFMASLAAQESGWGRYAAGNGTNLTGHGVYNSTYEGTVFGGIRENLLSTAELLLNNYLTPGGPNYYGSSIWQVNTDYCLTEDSSTTDTRWAEKITSIAYKLSNTYHQLF